jgi:hypothetical protein
MTLDGWRIGLCRDCKKSHDENGYCGSYSQKKFSNTGLSGGRVNKQGGAQ